MNCAIYDEYGASLVYKCLVKPDGDFNPIESIAYMIMFTPYSNKTTVVPSPLNVLLLLPAESSTIPAARDAAST